MSDREALAMPSFDDIDDFAPRSGAPAGQGAPAEVAVAAPQPIQAASQPAVPPAPRAAETRRAIDAVSQFPSREASTEAQMNLKGLRHVLDRFRWMCKHDRRAYYDMLEILMDSFEGRQGR